MDNIIESIKYMSWKEVSDNPEIKVKKVSEIGYIPKYITSNSNIKWFSDNLSNQERNLVDKINHIMNTTYNELIKDYELLVLIDENDTPTLMPILTNNIDIQDYGYFLTETINSTRKAISEMTQNSTIHTDIDANIKRLFEEEIKVFDKI